MDYRVRVSPIQFHTLQKKNTKIISCASSGAEGETRQGKPCLACFASSPIFCPFCFAKDGLLSSSLSYSISHSPKRKSTKIIPCASSGAEGETRQGKPCLACFASSPIFCPFCFAKDGLLSSSLSYSISHSPKRKSTKIIPCASSGAEGETRTLAPVSRPTPLAGAPRHQLEYFRR